jgi:hypothetical protein
LLLHPWRKSLESFYGPFSLLTVSLCLYAFSRDLLRKFDSLLLFMAILARGVLVEPILQMAVDAVKVHVHLVKDETGPGMIEGSGLPVLVAIRAVGIQLLKPECSLMAIAANQIQVVVAQGPSRSGMIEGFLNRLGMA